MYIFNILSLVAASLTVVSATPVSTCQQIDLSAFFSRAGAKIVQVAEYYNVTTYEDVIVPINGTNTTQTNEIVNQVYFNISGSATILDACTFQLDNFTASAIAPDTVIYGKMSSDYTVGQQVSWGSVLPTNGTTLQYTLVDGITFENIDTLILYSRPAGLQLAYVTFLKKTSSGDGVADNGNNNGTGTGTGHSSSASSRNTSVTSSKTVAIISSLVMGMLMLL